MEIVNGEREQYVAECGDGFELYSEYETIDSLSDISDEYKETLYADARDRVENSIAEKYRETYSGRTKMTASDLNVAGEYLLVAKTQGTDFENNNKYYVVYSATVSDPKGKYEPTTVYFPVEYDGVTKLPGNEYMTTAFRGIQGSSNVWDSWSYSTAGYADGVEMYTQVVNANRENYSYEVSEGLKAFGE